MKLLPFADIPFIEDLFPDAAQRKATVKDLSQEYWDVCHLVREGKEDTAEDYLFQIGFIVEGEVKTTKLVIQELTRLAVPYNEWDEMNACLGEIQNHLYLYCQKIEIIPPWGTPEFKELQSLGFTSRILQGPHKGGNLSKGESREVILKTDKEFAYGPTLFYSRLEEKVKTYRKRRLLNDLDKKLAN